MENQQENCLKVLYDLHVNEDVCASNVTKTVKTTQKIGENFAKRKCD